MITSNDHHLSFYNFISFEFSIFFNSFPCFIIELIDLIRFIFDPLLRNYAKRCKFMQTRVNVLSISIAKWLISAWHFNRVGYVKVGRDKLLSSILSFFFHFPAISMRFPRGCKNRAVNVNGMKPCVRHRVRVHISCQRSRLFFFLSCFTTSCDSCTASD